MSRFRIVAYEDEDHLKMDFEDPSEPFSVGGLCGCRFLFDTWREATQFANIVINRGGYAIMSIVDNLCEEVNGHSEIKEDKQGEGQ